MHSDFALLRPVDGRAPDWVPQSLCQHVRQGSKLLQACHGVSCWWNIQRRSLLVGWIKPQGDGIAALCEIPVVHPDGVTPDLWSFDALNKDLYLRKVDPKIKRMWRERGVAQREREKREKLDRATHDPAMLSMMKDRFRFGLNKAANGKHSKRNVLVNGTKE